MWPSMTFEAILNQMKYLRIHNVCIHIILYQNQFINESAMRIFSNSCNFVNTDFLRCRRTYILNNIDIIYIIIIILKQLVISEKQIIYNQ